MLCPVCDVHAWVDGQGGANVTKCHAEPLQRLQSQPPANQRLDVLGFEFEHVCRVIYHLLVSTELLVACCAVVANLQGKGAVLVLACFKRLGVCRDGLLEPSSLEQIIGLLLEQLWASHSRTALGLSCITLRSAVLEKSGQVCVAWVVNQALLCDGDSLSKLSQLTQCICCTVVSLHERPVQLHAHLAICSSRLPRSLASVSH
mmetsp:Transcript_116463/g.163769  ORF Transcript_116463/g.163769 Transcript_116463/m.163769 type:complete len:203 (+) Transcript_116463:87-695(+)